jgi:glycosyltransferase involved in cell wall biosynthesis
VIGAQIPAVAEMVEDGVDGYLVPVEDALALAARLEQLIQDPAHAQTMGAAGCRKLHARYTLKSRIEMIEGAYLRLLRHRQSHQSNLL